MCVSYVSCVHICVCVCIADFPIQSLIPGLPQYVQHVYAAAQTLGETTPLVLESKLRLVLKHLTPYVISRSLQELNARGS